MFTTQIATPGAGALIAASAQEIFDKIPLGAAISYSSGAPRPPERFRNKLRAWKQDNGSGTLIQKTDRYSTPTFTLHEGNFGSEGTIFLVVNRTYSVGSSLKFTIESVPLPGQVLVVTRSVHTGEELRHIAPDIARARAWCTHHRYSDSVLLEVQDDGSYAEHAAEAVAA